MESGARDRTLEPEETRAFYDRFGWKQDLQFFYEDRATRDLRRRGAFEEARSVLEFGCGTGRFARTLLRRHLPPDARYLGLDVSETMVALARRRLGPWAHRARVERVDGSLPLEVGDGTFERFVSNFVFDLLSEEGIRGVLAEAGRILVPGGRLCATGLTPGQGGLPRLVSRGWTAVFRWRPALVGGCRPVRVVDRLDPGRWRVVHHRVVTGFGIPSEVLVAERV